MKETNELTTMKESLRRLNKILSDKEVTILIKCIYNKLLSLEGKRKFLSSNSINEETHCDY